MKQTNTTRNDSSLWIFTLISLATIALFIPHVS